MKRCAKTIWNAWVMASFAAVVFSLGTFPTLSLAFAMENGFLHPASIVMLAASVTFFVVGVFGEFIKPWADKAALRRDSIEPDQMRG